MIKGEFTAINPSEDGESIHTKDIKSIDPDAGFLYETPSILKKHISLLLLTFRLLFIINSSRDCNLFEVAECKEKEAINLFP